MFGNEAEILWRGWCQTDEWGSSAVMTGMWNDQWSWGRLWQLYFLVPNFNKSQQLILSTVNCGRYGRQLCFRSAYFLGDPRPTPCRVLHDATLLLDILKSTSDSSSPNEWSESLLFSSWSQFCQERNLAETRISWKWVFYERNSHISRSTAVNFAEGLWWSRSPGWWGAHCQLCVKLMDMVGSYCKLIQVLNSRCWNPGSGLLLPLHTQKHTHTHARTQICATNLGICCEHLYFSAGFGRETVWMGCATFLDTEKWVWGCPDKPRWIPVTTFGRVATGCEKFFEKSLKSQTKWAF